MRWRAYSRFQNSASAPDATAADLRLALTSELGPDATAEDLQLALTNDELSPPLLAAA
ncbi:hypothetical protein GCM10020221_16810 [Streptomyces thioluteus]|uniref:Uncharacterized protein n=1 Tax=Streptomyces thioluteus TaxID=66431 RepID=A0ABP6J4V2_STRTU